MTIAEEFTAWPGVSKPAHDGGLGFGFKWNMGWMHDTLEYIGRDPVHRRWHHHKMTFGLLYAFTENFVLPLSHDEVVHGKGSLLGEMPRRRLAEIRQSARLLRLHVGPSGQEAAVHGPGIRPVAEWNVRARRCDWWLLGTTAAPGRAARCSRDLNQLYRERRRCIARDCEPAGFRWIVADDAENSVYAWLRIGRARPAPVAVVSNFTPVPRDGYRIGLPLAGRVARGAQHRRPLYGGCGIGNLGAVEAATAAAGTDSLLGARSHCRRWRRCSSI